MGRGEVIAQPSRAASSKVSRRALPNNTFAMFECRLDFDVPMRRLRRCIGVPDGVA
jgi:hypothetical protein